MPASLMEFLDVPTLLQISAAFNVIAALAWLVLASTFRIAPRASWLMVASHLVRVPPLTCGDCLAHAPTALRLALPELLLMSSVVLLLFALRRMVASRVRARHIGWISVLGATGILAGVAAGSVRTPQLANMLSMGVLAALAVREIWRGVGDRLSRSITVCTTLPFAALAVLSLVQASLLLFMPGWTERLLTQPQPGPARAIAGLVVTVGITLSLLALMIWRLVMRIQHLTHRDPLTGALNRRAFELALAEAQASLTRGRGFALVMIDIDHFKRINDEHGHAAGDAALLHCVTLWQGALRALDRLGRLGGEEFCVLLPLDSPGDLAAAASVAERLRSQLAATPLRWRDADLPLTASFGVALPVVGDATGEIAVVRADAELYRAKAEGRNRVCVATHLGGASS
ncbi:MAG: GGDEF domain-containing protein [Burkholderiales bacterium]|nr:MAG: GGDEF domain-containing protein [Burkholderiales bacterium]